jgi:hypothetical protein
VGATRVTAVITAFVVVFTVVCGCGGSDPRVRELLREANSHLKASAGYVKEVEESARKQAQLTSGQTAEESAAGQRQLLSEARKAIESALEELDKATVAFESAGDKGLSTETRTYIEMKVDAVAEQKKSLEAGLQATDLRIKLADDTIAGAPLDEAWVRTVQRIAKLDGESKSYVGKAAELNKKADDYYDSKNLGN